jgi:hypothetical protein
MTLGASEPWICVTASSARLIGVDHARHQRLQLLAQVDHRAHRVQPGVGQRGMRAAPHHGHAPGVARRHQRALIQRKVTRLALVAQREVVQRKHRLAGKAVEQAVLDHLQRAGLAHLLGRLEDEVHRAAEVTALRQVPGRRQQHGGVAVVAAGVHAPVVGGAVGEMVFLLQRQRVQVGTQADGPWPVATLQHTHHTRAGHTGVHLDAPLAQQARHDLGRAVFFKAQLGVRMDVAAQAHEARHIGKTINQVHRGFLADQVDGRWASVRGSAPF